jgi:peptidoglycan/LPS O-acetylase OafA/YrhL
MLCLVFCIALLGIKLHLHAYLSDAVYAPLFLIGMISAEMGRHEEVARFCRTPTVSFIGVLALFVSLTAFPTSYGFAQYILLGLFFIPIAIGNNYFHLLDRGWSLVLGEVSYAIYLIHGLILYLFMSGMLFPNDRLQRMHGWIWLVLPFMALLVVGGSALAHRLIEAPFIALGRRISGRVKKSDPSRRIKLLAGQ